MLNGTYTSIWASVLLHLLLLFALIYSAIKQPKAIPLDKPKSIALKSFLYVKPKKITPQKKLIQTIESKKNDTKAVTKAPNKQLNKPLPKKITKPKNSDITKKQTSITQMPPTKNQSNLSSFGLLSNLRKNLQNKNSEQAFSELTQKRSASIMDGNPFPVSKKIIPLTIVQQQALNTTRSHVGTITKNDNGTCTIHREQVLGSPVEASTASFACGEGKFDKNFRQHMEKVRAKFK